MTSDSEKASAAVSCARILTGEGVRPLQGASGGWLMMAGDSRERRRWGEDDSERPEYSSLQHSRWSKASPFIGQCGTKPCARMSARATPE